MCHSRFERSCAARRFYWRGFLLSSLVVLTLPLPALSQEIIQKIETANERVELTANTSRILTLDQKIPRAQVNNPDILTLTPLSPNQIQISAKQSGVTQVNLWDENGLVYSVDVIVYGDVKELQMALKVQFPNSVVKVYRYTNSLMLKGFVDRPDHVSQIIRLAEDYAPKVINNISVGGVQQILLHVKVMEVSRTKLRGLGFDFAQISGNDFVESTISGLLTDVAAADVITSGATTLTFGIIDGANAFFGVLEALRQYDLMKILAEPTLVTVSGRPASFNVGGEFPILVPQSLGTVSIEYKKFGTQIEFVPIVLGNGNIRLEVRPRVSEIDSTRSVTIDNTTVPGLRVREVDTGVEMKAGQTLALAGLVQQRVEAQNRGFPFLADMPWIGAAFRRVEEEVNEIELLILVRPEYVAALDPCEVPPGGPGLDTTVPCDCELYFRGYIEVPRCVEQEGGPCGNGFSTVPRDPSMPYGVPFEEIPPAANNDVFFPGNRPTTVTVVDKHVRQPTRLSVRQDRYIRSQANQTGDISTRTTNRKRSGLVGPVGYDLKK